MKKKTTITLYATMALLLVGACVVEILRGSGDDAPLPAADKVALMTFSDMSSHLIRSRGEDLPTPFELVVPNKYWASVLKALSPAKRLRDVDKMQAMGEMEITTTSGLRITVTLFLSLVGPIPFRVNDGASGGYFRGGSGSDLVVAVRSAYNDAKKQRVKK